MSYLTAAALFSVIMAFAAAITAVNQIDKPTEKLGASDEFVTRQFIAGTWVFASVGILCFVIAGLTAIYGPAEIPASKPADKEVQADHENF